MTPSSFRSSDRLGGVVSELRRHRSYEDGLGQDPTGIVWSTEGAGMVLNIDICRQQAAEVGRDGRATV